jgi:protein SCO1/2
MRLGLALLLLVLPLPCLAGLTQNDLSTVRLAPAADARLPLTLAFRDAEGRDVTLGSVLENRAALILPVDYGCRVTCGPALAILAGALADTGLRPGSDFHLVLVGLNPHGSTDQARSFVEAQVDDSALAGAVSALTGDADAIRRLTEAIGYHYVEDPANQAFAHPIGVVAVTAEGRVARTLSTLSVDPADLRLALIEAGEGRVGGLTGRLALLCYGFDPVRGIYTARIQEILKVAGLGTVMLMAACIGLISWRVRRQRGVS